MLTEKARAARELVRSDYTWDAKAARIVDLYRSLPAVKTRQGLARAAVRA